MKATQFDNGFFFREKTARRYARESFRHLFQAEKSIIDFIGRDAFSPMAMLDLGVGGGRTTAHFQPLVRQYEGIDYSPEMLKQCRQRFPDIPNGRLRLGDVRNLRDFSPNSFDFVLFSFNGIDTLNPEDRRAALKEIHRVLKNGALFCFSTHNITWKGLYSLCGIGAMMEAWPNPRRLAATAMAQRKMRLANKTWSLKKRIDAIRESGYGMFYEGSIHQYFTTHEKQCRQLRDAGFNEIRAFAESGKQTDDIEELNSGFSIYYLARTVHA